MARPRHPNKHIERAVRYAEESGWRVVMASGHAWGYLYCPRATRDGCKVGVWSTPRNPEAHARHVTREVDSCDCPDPNTLPAEGAGDEHDRQE